MQSKILTFKKFSYLSRMFIEVNVYMSKSWKFYSKLQTLSILSRRVLQILPFIRTHEKKTRRRRRAKMMIWINNFFSSAFLADFSLSVFACPLSTPHKVQLPKVAGAMWRRKCSKFSEAWKNPSKDKRRERKSSRLKVNQNDGRDGEKFKSNGIERQGVCGELESRADTRRRRLWRVS